MARFEEKDGEKILIARTEQSDNTATDKQEPAEAEATTAKKPAKKEGKK